MVRSSGVGSAKPLSETARPANIDSRKGLISAPLMAATAFEAPAPAPPLCASRIRIDNGMIRIRSTTSAAASGAAAAGPKASSSNGNPRNPILPIAAPCPITASSPARSAKITRVSSADSANTVSPAISQAPRNGQSISSPKGWRPSVPMTRHGTPKLNTYALSPLAAASGTMARRAAIQPMAITTNTGMVRLRKVSMSPQAANTG
jgi:hypothetical protein